MIAGATGLRAHGIGPLKGVINHNIVCLFEPTVYRRLLKRMRRVGRVERPQNGQIEHLHPVWTHIVTNDQRVVAERLNIPPGVCTTSLGHRQLSKE